MNALDAIIAALAAGAGLAGWRVGFLARLAGWVGVALGLAAAVPLVEPVVTSVGGNTADTRVLAAAVFLVLAASVGQGVVTAVATLVGRLRGPVRLADRAAGAAVGVTGALVVVWMLVPSLAALPGWPARAARTSKVVAVIDQVAPRQPDAFAAWGRSVVRAPFPSVLDPLTRPPYPGVPPAFALDASVDARVRRSIVTVRGVACDRLQSGTGWVGAPGVVVTNAHVVAGERATTVMDSSGTTRGAAVIAFDARRDVAVLSVSGFDRPALAVTEPVPGARAAVYGHPGGGKLRVAPARIGERIVAIGTDIYRTGRSRRDVLVLAARLAPGDSGAPLVDAAGRVAGMAFAVDPGDSATSYALSPDEVEAVMRPAVTSGRRTSVTTGRCVVGG